MTTIASLRADLYRIPLPVTLSDSTHVATSRNSNFVTVRIADSDGVEGTGYTYTVGANGRAIRTTVATTWRRH